MADKLFITPKGRQILGSRHTTTTGTHIHKDPIDIRHRNILKEFPDLQQKQLHTRSGDAEILGILEEDGPSTIKEITEASSLFFDAEEDPGNSIKRITKRLFEARLIDKIEDED